MRRQDLPHDVLWRQIDRDHDRLLFGRRLLERRKLALEQARRHEVLVTRGDAPRDQPDIALEEDEANVRAVADQDIAITALECRAGDHAAPAGTALAVNPGGDRLEPRPAILIGKRNA